MDNRTDGVSIIVQGDSKTVDRFSNEILQMAPPASQIKTIEINATGISGYKDFRIIPSSDTATRITEISPDIAVCRECLADMDNDTARLNYPFINCTNCGPRFSIIEQLPYDRANTSMRSFAMCGDCQAEYDDISDRRFHAQPVACNLCGPFYEYSDAVKKIHGTDIILKEISEQISRGNSVAVKGLGGYHLMCDATNESAVGRMRRRKQRDAKPFAVMFRDLSAVNGFCFVAKEEEKELLSWRRPIVILKQRKELSPSVNNGLGTIGVMLPYMPFHYLIFRHLLTDAVVMTSGNISDEPVITDDEEATVKLGKIADAVVSYNRKIINRADDSVVRIINGNVSMLRRSRGYVPRPVDIEIPVDGILALGAEQKNSFCIGKGNQAIMSQYIGDIKNLATMEFMKESMKRFSTLFRFTPHYLACDLHPDYMSSRYAATLSDELNIPVITIQHHHAHIASCMAENHIDENVIGICLDGTGYGTDGNIWGGEFLVAGLEDFLRYTHFDYIPMPGGEKAVEEPWRLAFSYLYTYYGDSLNYEEMPVFRKIEKDKLRLLAGMISGGINSPLSSGAGRLFDAISALLGLCSTSTFDSEAPMRLESVIKNSSEDYYPYTVGETISFAGTLMAVISDFESLDVSTVSARFHNTVAKVILDVSMRIRSEFALNKVVLSGGVFQNRYLLERTIKLLESEEFKVFTNRCVPANDGGISLGQLVIASKIKGRCA